MVMLVSERNVEQVLLELKEYASGVDVEFVRKSVHCGVRLPEHCVACLSWSGCVGGLSLRCQSLIVHHCPRCPAFLLVPCCGKEHVTDT